MTEDDSFERQMARFAKAIAQKAANEKTPLEEATNAFKALTTYYAVLRRYPEKDDDGGAVTFDGIQEEVRKVIREESTDGDTPPVQGRGRH